MGSSSASLSSSSSCDSQYYSAIPSPGTTEFSDDGGFVSREDIRMDTAAALSSSSFSSCWSSSIASSCSTSQTSSANPSPTSHDVFISFRGEDTRYGFVSHLCASFTRHGIKTYMDCDLERGNEISSTLVVAIKQSKILLLVFSENYAESRWTMDELAKIMECKRTRGQHVIPIFYKVRPTDVRHQKGNYDIAFKRHKKLFKANSSTLQQWRTAMTEAADLAGWEISGSRSEAELVEEIANGVMRKLESMSRSPVIVGDIQNATEPQVANFASQNNSDDLNSGDSYVHDPTPEESFPNKCLSNRGNILGNLRDALFLKENEKLVLGRREEHDEASSSHSPKTNVYSLHRNRFQSKRSQTWWGAE
ncbi:hypothetical protein QN277_004236 [Acacia crassicarpa]|uniref:TIR domain-containing protein n=1 Tax=Acacia crassicarpa TaxID=499986 RepID=A0AAE1MDJ6_9FABA|nr:hypothetical protein QN277_004236 [Acacia crassicarpa]